MLLPTARSLRCSQLPQCLCQGNARTAGYSTRHAACQGRRRNSAGAGGAVSATPVHGSYKFGAKTASRSGRAAACRGARGRCAGAGRVAGSTRVHRVYGRTCARTAGSSGRHGGCQEAHESPGGVGRAANSTRVHDSNTVHAKIAGSSRPAGGSQVGSSECAGARRAAATTQELGGHGVAQRSTIDRRGWRCQCWHQCQRYEWTLS